MLHRKIVETEVDVCIVTFKKQKAQTVFISIQLWRHQCEAEKMFFPIIVIDCVNTNTMTTFI